MIDDIKITCEDGYELAATAFSPDEQPVKGAVMIGPATGIKRQFYFAFAQFLVDQGFGVITFDNRGIGGSSQGKPSHSKASLVCWGTLDMPAVLSSLKTKFPDVPYFLVGHSAGGQLLGLMPNVHDLTAFCNFASSSGRLRNMRLSYQYKAHFFMNFYIPMSNLLFGHTKSQWVGMGEPLPKRAARQWQQWCNGSGYVKMAFDGDVTKHYYNEMAMPSKWIWASDDDIANYDNVKDMLTVFPNIEAEVKRVSPQDHNLKEIGHMKFFSRANQKLWPEVSDYLSTFTA
ncbi:alpha/beta fold hydrolase [Alteromonas sp. KUL49]|uniref:alpha/beta hydrolase family protein n=1 Tax=Alteromonas sp. KUL49 TaxID=2480798 RepID=UPI00102EDFE9|nr:alpha/beta fold hydrolase [Alteromonas sp. KUL49]TAP42531.1 alpha/beta fold hydrolase [Alteromonas sp. KUL49]GEA10160.1 alpha/beta hydrolase [Alteromonas sp. KUL49]